MPGPRTSALASVAAAIVSTSLLLAACSSTSSTTNTTATPSGGEGAQATIIIKNFAFSPTPLTVTKGTTIKVVNDDQVAHTVTALNHSFDTGDISGGGGTASFKVDTVGTFPYMCTVHPFMHGSITVTG